MKLLPWILVAGLLAGVGWLYSAGQKKDAELAALRQDSQQLQTLRAELEETKNARAQAESDELTRLRREHDELLRLRNEARQLRGEKQQLATQVQTAQAQALGAQEQVQALRANAAPPAAPGQADPAAAQRARSGVAAPISDQDKLNLCLNNLRMIDGAKQQWALEKQKSAGTLFTPADIAPYLPNRTVPTCPAGGVYTLNPVGLAPICNIPGHTLSK